MVIYNYLFRLQPPQILSLVHFHMDDEQATADMSTAIQIVIDNKFLQLYRVVRLADAASCGCGNIFVCLVD